MKSKSPIQLKSRTLTGKRDGPHLLITGGVHGDEYEPMAAIRRLMSVIDARSLAGRVTLVPVVNEPAFESGARTAEDGLDLARVCPGKAKGSFTERIAFALSDLIRSADFYIDLHTGGNLFELYPLAGYMLHAKKRVLDDQRRMARAMNLPLVWGTTPNLNGRSLSVARDEGIPAIYAEHGGGGACATAGIDDYVDGCLNILRELKMCRGSPLCSRVRHVVEDPRDRSGFLQIQHPSPIDGFFTPRVKLGKTVRSGRLIGSVVDVLGGREYEVTSAENGIVVMLRSRRQVRKGDALVALASAPHKEKES